MAKKKIAAVVKIQIEAGQASPAPPVGTALGPHFSIHGAIMAMLFTLTATCSASHPRSSACASIQWRSCQAFSFSPSSHQYHPNHAANRIHCPPP